MGTYVDNRTDPRDEPNYTLAEAASYLRLSSQAVRFWAVGAEATGRRPAQPLLVLAQRTPPMLSFWNLVEIYILAGIRYQHHVSLQKVRKALHYVGEQLQVDRPLIEKHFMTDGVDLFIEEYSALVNVSRDGQTEIRAYIRGTPRRIDRDVHGLAARVFPWRESPTEPRVFEINPSKASGRLVIMGTRIPVEILAERHRGGDRIADLSRDYDLSAEKIEAAIQWM